jgi:hypothetical protein
MLQNNNNNNTLFPKQIQLIGLYNIYNMLIVPTAYKLETLFSVRNVKEFNNFGKYLCLAEKLRNV